jgi:UDP-hydrolysing UDP-N-acetyl-D-glucosamine 2-epimerase
MAARQKQRRIAVVTGSRAEFGLLAPVMRAIDAESALELKTVVTGTHLSAGTKQDMIDAGFTIDAEAPMQQAGEAGRAADVAAMGRGIATIGEALAALEPTAVVVLGDRIEAFAAATAAHVGGYHLAHLHGGDRAEGVADEAIRHAISKLAHLHLPATAASRRRLIRMGEDSAHVHRVGSPAIDGLKQVKAAADAPAVIVLQHPIGECDAWEQAWMTQTLAATADVSLAVLMPNHDPGRDGIVQAIADAKVEAVTHWPRARFLSMLKGAQVIVGNSSAGLIEAAALKTPCVNVGPRQAGREKPNSVIDCDYGEANVRAAIEQARALDLRGMRHPYGRGDTGQRVAQLLADLDLNAVPLRKRNVY